MKIYVFLLMFCLILPQMGQTKEVYGIAFSPTFRHEGEKMILKGTGLKRVFFMKAFVAGFYLEENIKVDDVFNDVPKRIEVSYFVNISREKLSNYTEVLMQRNMPEQEYKSLSDEIKLMREYFVDLEPGDRYALTYIPEIGTQFEYNGEVMGIIEGEKFARGIFSTWIGTRPMDKYIKQKILGLVSHISEDDMQIVLQN